MSEWDTYYKKHGNRKPRIELVRAIDFCKSKENALDLGSGTFIESLYLLENGFKQVTAVDNSLNAKEFANHINSEKLKFENIPFDQFIFEKEKYDLINAQYALPFYGKENFEQFFDDIKSSLKVGGIFAGQFFGDRDEWNTKNTKMAFQTKEEVEELLKDLEIIEFQEEEKDGTTAAGNQKHWHVFHVIAKK